MRIRITRGTGTGPTPLAAFDAALLAAGVENYNLIHLSSVMPPNACLERERFQSSRDEYGHRLYVVMAQQCADEPGSQAWAGLGWLQEAGDGRGLFVECVGPSEGKVRGDIEATLASMAESRGRSYGPIDCELAGIECEREPVCALVVAVYESEGWK